MEYAPTVGLPQYAVLLLTAIVLIYIAYRIGKSRTTSSSHGSARVLDVNRAGTILSELRHFITKISRDLREHNIVLDEVDAELSVLFGASKNELSADEIETKVRAAVSALRKANIKAKESANEVGPRLVHQKEQIDGLSVELRMDATTGLASRAALDDELSHWSARWLRDEASVCLAILSLDDKRRVGDRLGPATEQFIFREVAAIVAKHTRNCDMVARYGDNELAILIPNCELEEACHIAERVRVAVANHKPRYQGNDLRPNVSIGVAKAGRQSADIMLRLSEDAYRMAQRSGGNAVYFHDGHKCRPFTIARLQKAKEESNPNNKPGRERRRHPRRPFRTTQFLAVCANNKLPKAKDFQPVQCNDISPGGCSFFLDRPPEWEYVVVGLGSPPELMYFHARVRNVSTVTEGNRTWIRVGCEFTARLNAEQFGVEPEQIAKPVLAIVSGDYQEGVHQNCVGATR